MSIDTIRNEEESISGNAAVSKTSNLFFKSSDEFDMPSIRTMEKMKEHAQFLRGKSILLQGKEKNSLSSKVKLIE